MLGVILILAQFDGKMIDLSGSKEETGTSIRNDAGLILSSTTLVIGSNRNSLFYTTCRRYYIRQGFSRVIEECDIIIIIIRDLKKIREKRIVAERV